MAIKVEDYRNKYLQTFEQLRKSRLLDKDKEYARVATLFSNKNIMKKVEQHLNFIEQQKHYFNKQQVLILIGRAIEMKNVCKKTHFAFIHAQAAGGIVIIYLLKKLAEKLSSNNTMKFFKYLREPGFKSDLTIEEIAKNQKKTIDFQRSSDLLSADAYFFHTSSEESAIDFLSCNKSIQHSILELPKRISSILKKYGIEEQKLETKVEKLFSLIKNIDKQSSCGNLFLICIPKDKVGNIAYRAHPGGVYCKCHEKDNDLEILEKLNQGNLDNTEKCEPDEYFGDNPETPQYRLLTTNLTPENGVLIFLLSPLSKEAKKEIKKQIDEILN